MLFTKQPLNENKMMWWRYNISVVALVILQQDWQEGILDNYLIFKGKKKKVKK